MLHCVRESVYKLLVFSVKVLKTHDKDLNSFRQWNLQGSATIAQEKTMALIQWQDTQHALQTGAMDITHREFVVLNNALAGASDDTELTRLERLISHCRDHFAQEKLWMDASGMPRSAQHQHDHEAVMEALETARTDLRAGKAGAGRRASEVLAQWFEQHGATMDAALAFHLQQSIRPVQPGIPAVG
jgi:hemerythrin